MSAMVLESHVERSLAARPFDMIIGCDTPEKLRSILTHGYASALASSARSLGLASEKEKRAVNERVSCGDVVYATLNAFPQIACPLQNQYGKYLIVLDRDAILKDFRVMCSPYDSQHRGGGTYYDAANEKDRQKMFAECMRAIDPNPESAACIRVLARGETATTAARAGLQIEKNERWLATLFRSGFNAEAYCAMHVPKPELLICASRIAPHYISYVRVPDGEASAFRDVKGRVKPYSQRQIPWWIARNFV